MTMKVKCFVRVAIELPDGETARKGERLRCPAGCPKFENCHRRRIVDGKSYFVVKDADVDASDATRYSDEEAAEIFKAAYGQAGMASPPRQSKPQSRSGTSAQGGEARRAPAASQAAPSKNTSASRFGAIMRRGAAPSAPSVRQNDDPTIDIGGILYARDLKKHRGSKPLSDAYAMIKGCWLLDSVFEDERGTRLKADFRDCFMGGRNVDNEALDKLLASTLDRDRKFFFLDASFISNNRRGEFYFPVSEKGEFDAMAPVFRGEKDFETKYFGGGTFTRVTREIANKASCRARGVSFPEIARILKREILFRLGYIDRFDADAKQLDDAESELCRKLTCDSPAFARGSIVRVVRLGDSGKEEIGTLEELKRTMSDPAVDRKKKRAADDFLKKYRVSAKGDVTPRDGRTDGYGVDAESADGDIFNAIGFASSSEFASEYASFLSMLGEYARVFRPDKVTLGEKTFSRSGFSKEICGAVFEYVALACGDAADVEVRRARGVALLCRDLYEKVGLYEVENAAFVEDVLALLDAAERKLSDYISLCAQAGEKPLIAKDGELLSADEYLTEILEGKGLKDALAALDGRFAKEFLAARGADASSADVETLEQNYQKMFDKFKGGKR